MRFICKEVRQQNKLPLKNTVLVVAFVVAAFTIGGFAGVSLAVDRNTFAQGVSIEGTNISGMRFDEAEKLVLSNADKQLSEIKLPVVYNNQSADFNADDLGIETNASGVLNDAFEYNKNEDDSLTVRFDKSVKLAVGTNYKLAFTVDEDKLKSTLTQFSQKNGKKVVEAQAVFDKETQSFRYTQGQTGNAIDVEDTATAIEARIKDGDFSEFQIQGKEVIPKLSVEYLKRNTSLISISETKANSDPDRNTNIRLMLQALDGQVIQPGQTLSVNDLVGERTNEKGFKKAPAIIDGTLTDQVGGGICQVSGTLYNAALLADMQIVERVRHTWPSSYLPIGLDATLNWDDKDLKIKNKSDLPMYISAKFEDQTVRVEIYGQPLPDGITIAIDNKIIEKFDPPPSDIIYTNALTPGVKQTQKSPRAGYTVDVYRNYIQDGIIVKSELISKDNYPAIKGVVLEGTDARQK